MLILASSILIFIALFLMKELIYKLFRISIWDNCLSTTVPVGNSPVPIWSFSLRSWHFGWDSVNITLKLTILWLLVKHGELIFQIWLILPVSLYVKTMGIYAMHSFIRDSDTLCLTNSNLVKTNKSAVCIKGAKHVSKALYNNPRWTLMPNFDLCQYYPTGNYKITTSRLNCERPSVQSYWNELFSCTMWKIHGNLIEEIMSMWKW